MTLYALASVQLLHWSFHAWALDSSLLHLHHKSGITWDCKTCWQRSLSACCRRLPSKWPHPHDFLFTYMLFNVVYAADVQAKGLKPLGLSLSSEVAVLCHWQHEQ